MYCGALAKGAKYERTPTDEVAKMPEQNPKIAVCKRLADI